MNKYIRINKKRIGGYEMIELFKDLSKNYKGDQTPQSYKNFFELGYENEVIADIYVSNYKLFYKAASQYGSIDSATKDSVIVEMIWKAIKDLDISKLQVKLNSYIIGYIKSELRCILQANTYDKRKINMSDNSVSFTDLTTDNGDATDKFMNMGELDDTTMLEMVSFINSLQLPENQRKYCEVALRGEVGLKYGTIANAIGVSRAGAKKIREKLQLVCADLIV